MKHLLTLLIFAPFLAIGQSGSNVDIAIVGSWLHTEPDGSIRKVSFADGILLFYEKRTSPDQHGRQEMEWSTTMKARGDYFKLKHRIDGSEDWTANWRYMRVESITPQEMVIRWSGNRKFEQSRTFTYKPST